MKKSAAVEQVPHGPNLEILKAVAQAWHAHSGSSRPTNEYDAYRRNFQPKPSRFKVEAIKNRSKSPSVKQMALAGVNWDFNQSLLDAYEIVTLSKKLERGLMLDDPFAYQNRVSRRKRQSKNSLRSLFNRISSRRFNEAAIPRLET